MITLLLASRWSPLGVIGESHLFLPLMTCIFMPSPTLYMGTFIIHGYIINPPL